MVSKVADVRCTGDDRAVKPWIQTLRQEQDSNRCGQQYTISFGLEALPEKQEGHAEENEVVGPCNRRDERHRRNSKSKGSILFQLTLCPICTSNDRIHNGKLKESHHNRSTIVCTECAEEP